MRTHISGLDFAILLFATCIAGNCKKQCEHFWRQIKQSDIPNNRIVMLEQTLAWLIVPASLLLPPAESYVSLGLYKISFLSLQAWRVDEPSHQKRFQEQKKLFCIQIVPLLLPMQRCRRRLQPHYRYPLSLHQGIYLIHPSKMQQSCLQKYLKRHWSRSSIETSF